MPKGTPLDLSSGFKTCPDCKTSLPLERFGKSSRTVHGYQSVCKACAYVRHKKFMAKNPGYGAKFHREAREKDPERYRDYSTKKLHGLPPGTYAKMLATQNGKCAICATENPGQRKKFRFHIDHCHDTGIIRGLLCHNCNVGIGNLRHDPKIMAQAITYLTDYPTLSAKSGAESGGTFDPTKE